MDFIPQEFVICFDLLVLAVAFGANALAGVVILVKTPLEKPENLFLLNNLMCNLMCECLMAPQLLMRDPFDCIIVEFTVSFMTVSNSMSILLISLDQYTAIADPLNYQRKLNAKRSSYFIALQWILSFVIGILTTLATTPAPGVWKICKFPNDLPEEIEFDNYRNFCAALLMSVTVLCFSATLILFGRATEIYYCNYEVNALVHPFKNLTIDPVEDEEKKIDKDRFEITFNRFIFMKQKKALGIFMIFILYCFISQIPLALVQLSSSMGVIPYRGLLVGSAVSPFLFAYRKRHIVLEIYKLKTFFKNRFPQRQVDPIVVPADAERVPLRQRYSSASVDSGIVVY